MEPDIDEAILHVKPAFDTALSPQDSLQATTTQCFINVLNLDSDNQQSQLPAIENPPSPEPKQGSVINGEVIIHVILPLEMIAMHTENTHEYRTGCINFRGS